LIDDQATAKQTIIKIPFFWDMTLHHVPGDRILSYTVVETSGVISFIVPSSISTEVTSVHWETWICPY